MNLPDGLDGPDRPAEQMPEAAPESESSTQAGHRGVVQALELLDGLDSTPIEEHPRVFDEIHRGLRSALNGEQGA